MSSFVIVGKKDPVYEAEFRAPSGGAGPTSSAFLSQFVVYSSLDMVESALWVNRYLLITYIIYRTQ